MYYHAIASDLTILEERRGQQFGPLCVVKVKGKWQIDHWPTGARIAPIGGRGKLTYTAARSLASALRLHPALQRRNLHLYWEHHQDSNVWRTRCPEITDQIKKLIQAYTGV